MRKENGIEDIYISRESNDKSKKSNKFLIIIIIIAIILLFLIGIYFFIMKSSENVSKNMFKKGFESSNIIKIADNSFYTDLYQKLLSKNSEINTKINFSNGNSANSERKVDLTKFGINLYTKTDTKKDRTYDEVNINFANNDFLTLKLLTDERSYGILQEQVVNKYIATRYENSNKMLGINIDTEKLDEAVSIKAIDMLPDEKEKYIRSLFNNFMNNVSEDKFEVTENISLDKNGSSIPVTAYTLSFSQDEFKSYLIAFLSSIKNDEEFLKKLSNASEGVTIDAKAIDNREQSKQIEDIESLVVTEDEDSTINLVIRRQDDNENNRYVIERNTNSPRNEIEINAESSQRNQTEQPNNERERESESEAENNDRVEQETTQNENIQNITNNQNVVENQNTINTNTTNNIETINTNETTNNTIFDGFFQIVGTSDENTNVDIANEIDEADIQELNVNVVKNKKTYFQSLLDEFELDTLYINDFMKDKKVLKNDDLCNVLRFILGIKIDEKVSSLKKRIEEYIGEVEDYKGNGLKVIVYVSDEKTEKISFELPNQNKLEIEFLKTSNEENNIKITYLYKGDNSQLFNIQDSISYSAGQQVDSNRSDTSDKYNGFSLEIDKYTDVSNNNLKLLYQKIDNEEVNEKCTLNLKTIGDINSNVVKNNATLIISTNKLEEQYTIDNNINFSTLNDIEDLNDDNSVFLDELSNEDYEKLKNILQDRINKVKRAKEQSINILNENGSSSIFTQKSSSNIVTRDSARAALEDKIRQMKQAYEREEVEFTIDALNGLSIDGYDVSTTISTDKAIIMVDVYAFSIDKDFNLADVN